MDERSCQKIQLVRRDGLCAQYCQVHQTIELMIGAVSLRLDVEAFRLLSAALDEANLRLEMLEQGQHTFDRFMQRMRKA